MTFTASTGGTVAVAASGHMLVTDYTRVALGAGVTRASRSAHIDAEMVPTLREFFQDERDEELGRWRWPENPEWIVYPRRPGFAPLGDADLLVINEVHGASMEYVAADDDGTEYVGVDEAAAKAGRAYFEAHPEPKPWEDAKAGEIWVLTFPGGTFPATVRNDLLFYDNYGNRLHLGRVSAARRIWPEAS